MSPVTTIVDVIFPGDANHHGTLFGGVALAHMDRAAFIAATRHSRTDFVTASAERTDFVAPARIGEIAETSASVSRVGRRSLSVDVELVAEELESGSRRICARSRFRMVATGPKAEGDFRLPPLPAKLEAGLPRGLTMAGIVFPDEASHYGSLFGGNALALMAKGAFVAASRHCRSPVVLAASRNVEFVQQVRVGEIVEIVPSVVATGTSSLTIEVELWAEGLGSERRRCGRASFTMVAVGPTGRPVPLSAIGDENPS